MTGHARHRHGGRLRAAAALHGRPVDQWLDLSTGINPCGWPVPTLPPECWLRLPEDDDGLAAAAAHFYGVAEQNLLPVAGSQAALQTLPQLRAPGRVGIPDPGYAEHALAWQRHGHTVVAIAPEHPADDLDTLDVLLLIHPNNPTGQRYPRECLLEWHARLAQRGGWLVIDEAFIDVEPQQSVADRIGRPGLIVLRSLGKFFGLAGLRAGFALAERPVLQALGARLGPWAVSHPARHIARLALADAGWADTTRRRLRAEGERLRQLLCAHGLAPAGGTALFQWVRDADAAVHHTALARHGVLVRRFDAPPSLRFGLPADAADWQRLDNALAHTTDNTSGPTQHASRSHTTDGQATEDRTCTAS